MANYKQPDLDQMQWISINLREMFPEDHPIRRFRELVCSLDYSQFDEKYKNDSDKGGRPAFPPDIMMCVILWHMLHGGVSMRALARDLQVRVDLMYLAGGLLLDHSSISRFHTRHAESIKALGAQIVTLGLACGDIDLNLVWIDGTKIRANAGLSGIVTKKNFQRQFDAVIEAISMRYEEYVSEGDEKKRKIALESLKRAERKREKLIEAWELMEATGRTSTHLHDKDASIMNSGKGGELSVNAIVAADHKSGMVVHVSIETQQNDNQFTVDTIYAIEELRKRSGLDVKTTYVADSGFSSQEALELCQDLDLYIPDKAMVSQLRRRPTGKRVEPLPAGVTMEFKVDAHVLECEGERILRRRSSRMSKSEVCYDVFEASESDCKYCHLHHKCVGKDANAFKKVSVPINGLDRDYSFKTYPSGTFGKGSKRLYEPTGRLLLEMREKILSDRGKELYSKRMAGIEGVFGVIKACRNGWRTLRRGVDKVLVEKTEQVMAFNIGKLIGFNREALQ